LPVSHSKLRAEGAVFSIAAVMVSSPIRVK